MELPRILEALLFASDKPLPVARFVQILRDAAQAEPGEVTESYANLKEGEVEAALQQLQASYEESGAGVGLIEVAGGYQLRSQAEAATWVRLLFEDAKPPRLSQPALETLAIIAYRQPISRAEMESVRGVAVDGVVATLVERKLIKIAGRSEQPGRPLLYATTPAFLEEFGLKALDELPNADELRRMQLQKEAEEKAAAEEAAKEEGAAQASQPELEPTSTEQAGENTDAATESSGAAEADTETEESEEIIESSEPEAEAEEAAQAEVTDEPVESAEPEDAEEPDENEEEPKASA